MAQLTAFGKRIKKRLVDIDQTQDWLIEQVRQETSLFFDGGYLYKIMAGKRNAPILSEAIRKILDLSNDERVKTGDSGIRC
jgi:hypothetical protein